MTDQMTTYRVILDTETRPKRAAASLDLPSVAVEAPDVDTAARLAVAHHIDNRPDPPPPAGTSFGLIVITPKPNRPDDPHHDLDDDAELHHVDVAYWPTNETPH